MHLTYADPGGPAYLALEYHGLAFDTTLLRVYQALDVQVHVSVVADPGDPGGYEYATTTWPLAANDYMPDQEPALTRGSPQTPISAWRADMALREDIVVDPDTATAEEIALLSDVVHHELAHVLVAAMLRDNDPAAVKADLAADFGVSADLWDATPWENSLREAVAETIKDLSANVTRWTNRTNHQLPFDNIESLRLHMEEWLPHGVVPTDGVWNGGNSASLFAEGWSVAYPGAGHSIPAVNSTMDGFGNLTFIYRFFGGGLESWATALPEEAARWFGEALEVSWDFSLDAEYPGAGWGASRHDLWRREGFGAGTTYPMGYPPVRGQDDGGILQWVAVEFLDADGDMLAQEILVEADQGPGPSGTAEVTPPVGTYAVNLRYDIHLPATDEAEVFGAPPTVYYNDPSEPKRWPRFTFPILVRFNIPTITTLIGSVVMHVTAPGRRRVERAVRGTAVLGSARIIGGEGVFDS